MERTPQHGIGNRIAATLIISCYLIPVMLSAGLL